MERITMRKRLPDLSSPVTQYIIGLIAGLSYFLVLLLSSKTSYANLQAPEGIYSNNLLQTSDLLSYVNPARNYLSYGVFGKEYAPDYFRTIGYPAFLALMIKLFGTYWLYATYIVQIFLYAFIYPVLSGIIHLLTPGNEKLVRWSFVGFLLTGMYFTRGIAIGTDLPFTLLFTSGLYYGMKSLTGQDWKNLLLYILFISLAAEIRPTLILFPAVSIVFLLFIAKRSGNMRTSFTRKAILISTAALLVTCNIPSLRNYINYGFFKPSNVLDLNCFICLDFKVLVKENKADQYLLLEKHVNSKQDIIERMELQKDITKRVIKHHSLRAAEVILIDNMKNILFDNHLSNVTGMYYGYSWKSKDNEDLFGNKCYAIKKSHFLLACYYIIAAVYLGMYILFTLFCIRLVRARKWLYLLTICSIMGMLLAPAIITGNCGSRFRLPVEGLLIIFSLSELIWRSNAFRSNASCDQETYL